MTRARLHARPKHSRRAVVGRVAGLVAALSLSLCAAVDAAEDVEVKYDASLDASGYETFTWIDTEQKMADHPLTPGAPLDRAIRGAIETELAKRGLRAVESGGDIRLRYHAAVTDAIEGSFLRERVGDGQVIAEGVGDLMYQRSFQVGSMALEVLDASQDRVLWRGVSRMTLKRERPLEDGPEARKLASKLAAKIARKFPPD